MEVNGEIYVVPFFGQGHILPSVELCKQFSSRNFTTKLIIPSHFSSSIPTPSLLHQYPLIHILTLSNSLPPPPPPPSTAGAMPCSPNQEMLRRPCSPNQEMGQEIEKILLSNHSPRPTVAAVVDIMVMDSVQRIFRKYGIPVVAFFTSGACSAAMEYGMSKARAFDVKPGHVRILPGLPEDMAVTISDIQLSPPGPPPPPGLDGPGSGPGFSPPPPPGLDGPGSGPRFFPPPPPPWMDDVGESVGLLINTSDELEGEFLTYIADRVRRPVWGVGPLLPKQYWEFGNSVLLNDKTIRPNRLSNYSEEDVLNWLDSKPSKSVIYVSFGTEVGPTREEYVELADALAESGRPFIWVIKSGVGIRPGPPNPPGSGRGLDPPPPPQDDYYPNGLNEKVGDKGMIIRGWAPQLTILRHGSTGFFLSHCGWNSTTEAIARGVPILAWPIRGDQMFNAKLVVSHLKVGHRVSYGTGPMKKDNILQGIERLGNDEDLRARAATLAQQFHSTFPTSSTAALNAFTGFIQKKNMTS